jgi:hypothetical protein
LATKQEGKKILVYAGYILEPGVEFVDFFAENFPYVAIILRNLKKKNTNFLPFLEKKILQLVEICEEKNNDKIDSDFLPSKF